MYRLTAEERAATELRRFDKRAVPAARRAALFGVRGWQHGRGTRMRKPLGGEVAVELEIAATSVHARGDTAADRLGILRLESGAPFSSLPDVVASELLRDLEELAPGAAP